MRPTTTTIRSRDRYNEPISFDGNPACMSGAMHDLFKWIMRSGNYQMLFEHRAGPLSNRALAIDHPDNVQFIEQRLPNADLHDVNNPCLRR